MVGGAENLSQFIEAINQTVNNDLKNNYYLININYNGEPAHFNWVSLHNTLEAVRTTEFKDVLVQIKTYLDTVVSIYDTFLIIDGENQISQYQHQQIPVSNSLDTIVRSYIELWLTFLNKSINEVCIITVYKKPQTISRASSLKGTGLQGNPNIMSFKAPPGSHEADDLLVYIISHQINAIKRQKNISIGMYNYQFHEAYNIGYPNVKINLSTEENNGIFICTNDKFTFV